MSEQVNFDATLSKLAEMGAEELQGAMPADPAAAGAAPPMDPTAAGGAPMDPAMAAAGGMPMDPAMMAPPQTIEELLATGDPIVKLIVEINEKLDRISKSMGALLDGANATVPASQVLNDESAIDAVDVPPVEAAVEPASAEPKAAAFEAASSLVDPTGEEVDTMLERTQKEADAASGIVDMRGLAAAGYENVEESKKQASGLLDLEPQSEEPSVLSLGQPGVSGTGLGMRLETGMASVSGRMSDMRKGWMNRGS